MDNDLPCRDDLVEVYRYLTSQDQTGLRGKAAGSKLLEGGAGIHAGLWLDKYIGKQAREDTTSRRTLVEQVSLIPLSASYRQFYERWEKVIQREYGAQVQYGTVQGRMVVGLGDEGVLETSVTLHRTYGVPYIPGSALKGLAAHYANLRAPEGSGWKKGEEQYNVVFGRMEEEGGVIFFDALYIPPDKAPDKGPLHPDIITVHHREYYQDAQKAPADWDSPTPIPFLSATGTYLIALAAPELPQSEQWIGGVFAILKLALKEMGIGAKTSSGYGRMTLKPVDKGEITAPMSMQAESNPYMRPNIPKFSVNDNISGSVMEPTDELRRKVPEAKAYLRYREFSPKQVLIVVEFDEAASWLSGQTKNCLFLREEEREGCTVLICKPGVSKVSKKKKGSR